MVESRDVDSGSEPDAGDMPSGVLSDARMIVRDFAQVRPDETVTVFSDRPRRVEGEALALAVRESGAAVIHVDISQAVERVLQGPDFWLDPPASILACAQSSNVSLFAVDETYAFRLDHRVSSLFQTGQECSIFKVDVGMGTWRLTAEGMAVVDANGRALLRATSGCDQVRITSASGTDLRLSIRGRQCLEVPQVPSRGLPYGISVPLWGEYNWAPVDGSPDGTVVIDGLSEAGAAMAVVTEPVSLTVTGGLVTAVQGASADADAFRAVLATDAGASVVGELGIGANPNARIGTETEKALLGTVHLGFGNNTSYPGGTNRSAIHVDGVVRNARVEVDGRLLLEGGRLIGDGR